MPIYEYKCGQCSRRFEKIQKMADPPCKKCPHCGGPLTKLISSPSIQFKGNGFYITDYAKKCSPSEEKKAKADTEPKSESKPEAKSEAKSEAKAEKKAKPGERGESAAKAPERKPEPKPPAKKTSD